MIPNHSWFIEAIDEKKKVRVRLYSKADSGLLDRVCAPMDYGPGEVQDGLNRYWLWDYDRRTGSHTLGLLPQEVVDLQVLGEVFDPAELGNRPWPWSIPRDWGSHPQTICRPIGASAPIPVAAPAVGTPAPRPESIRAQQESG